MSSSAVSDGVARTAKARAAHLQRAANRAVDDDVQLARAARIVRAALARRVLTVDDLAPTAGGPDAAA